jgi:hypothetical protein
MLSLIAAASIAADQNVAEIHPELCLVKLRIHRNDLSGLRQQAGVNFLLGLAALRGNSMGRFAILTLAMTAIVACCIADAKAKGGSYQKDEVYNPQHIISLPLEIRASVYARCNEPHALHTFAEYRDNLRIVTLHFEHLLCGTSEFQCPASGCLHEVFTQTPSGRYKLIRRYYSNY